MWCICWSPVSSLQFHEISILSFQTWPNNGHKKVSACLKKAKILEKERDRKNNQLELIHSSEFMKRVLDVWIEWIGVELEGYTKGDWNGRHVENYDCLYASGMISMVEIAWNVANDNAPGTKLKEQINFGREWDRDWASCRRCDRNFSLAQEKHQQEPEEWGSRVSNAQTFTFIRSLSTPRALQFQYHFRRVQNERQAKKRAASAAEKNEMCSND